MIDLHMHTVCSDGQYSPAEVLKKCQEAQLDLISITDHFSIAAYDEIKVPEIRALFSGKILVGCEFPAQFKGQTVEVLGYGFDPEDAREYLSQYPSLRDLGIEEKENQLRQYKGRGFITEKALTRENYPTNVILWEELNRHPENRARYLNPQSAESSQNFFRKEMGDYRSPFFFDSSRHFPPVEEVVKFIRSAGGIAILAHPLTYSDAICEELEELIENAKPDGLEVWYAPYEEKQRQRLTDLCQKYNLIFSGGSDFHNDRRIAWGNIIGMPQFDSIFPTETILKWVQNYKLI